MISPRIDLGTFSVLDWRDNHYTKKSELREYPQSCVLLLIISLRLTVSMFLSNDFIPIFLIDIFRKILCRPQSLTPSQIIQVILLSSFSHLHESLVHFHEKDDIISCESHSFSAYFVSFFDTSLPFFFVCVQFNSGFDIIIGAKIPKFSSKS